jgi:two-component system cell cycle response regulator DivK
VCGWLTKMIETGHERRVMRHPYVVSNPNSRPTRRMTRGRIAAAVASSASHDLRTPLATVLGMSELLAKTDLTPRQASYASAIRRAGEAMLAVIEAQREWGEAVAAARPTTKSDATKGALSGRRVLVVDDSDESHDVIAAFLEDTGASVFRARDGAASVDVLRRERFDLVLMDMHLTGMDGIATTRAIRRGERDRRERSVPIVAVSADASAQSARRALAAGCAAYVSKPTDRGTLVDMIVTHVAPSSTVAPPSALPHLLPKFVSNRERDLVALREALAGGRFDAIAEIGHKLHGNGASYGFPHLSALGRDLEAAARAERHEAIADCLEQLTDAVVELRLQVPDGDGAARPRSGTRIRIEGPPLVLIVDDFEDSRAMYAAHFRDEGFDVVEAADGATAVARARESKPAVVVMDLSLPGMDGWDAIRALKSDEATRDVPVLALTGHSGASDEEGAREAGCDAFVAKPCLPSALLAKVSELIDRSGVAQSASPR